ncbi:MAG TPA: M10 family metallopeptidase C-terminal domain-containing protein, partial [Allosphingosinicella sp.]|nr:M10 family metallopeptidase C-terminal domain-containing protein [Allosphingosinicella sp.]
MSKAFKSIFAETGTIESADSASGRQAYLLSLVRSASVSVPLAAGDAVSPMSAPVGPASASEPSASATEPAGATAGDLIIVDDGGEASEITVLECLEPKEMIQLFMASHGSDPSLAAAPTPGFEIFDEGAMSVTVGGSVSGVIDTDGDTDDITVSLVAGQTYLVSLRGTGAGALSDPLLQVYAPDGVTLVASDDDGGTSHNSLLTFTASQSGDFVIRAASFNNSVNDVGAYTVDVRVQGADSVGFTNATAGSIGLGTSFGFREFGTGNQSPLPGTLDGDTDRYAITLQAGHFYLFEVAAGFDGAAGENLPPFGGASNAMNTLIVLRNGAGQIVNNGRGQSDNIGTDLSSAFGFTATETGTYYLDVHARSGQTGGYVINVTDVDFSGLDPLDAINWVNADNIDTVDVGGVPTAYVYFGAAGETFGEPITTFGWNATEKAAVMAALAEFGKITGIQYLETNDVNQAEFRLNTVNTGNFGAYFYPQDPVFGSQQGIGIFNVNSGLWDKPGVSTTNAPGDQLSLEKGGFAFAVILHEFGHGHGLSHAHDTGGGSQIMPGVINSTLFYSVYNLNQGIYTVMSYNDAYQTHPDGTTALSQTNMDNGWSGSLSAFDIAVLQDRYGVHAHNSGDNVYTITDVENDAFFECIWDSGGTDAIVYNGNVNAVIDLTAATLDYSPTGGGPLSFINAAGTQTYRGGYTIANGVVIENATGGGGNDQLIGNAAANLLTGNGGNDALMGRGGNDTLVGGLGTDTAHYEGARSNYTVTAIVANGVITGYTVTDNFPLIAAATADEGVDSLSGVETLQFTDMAMSLTGPVLLYDGGGVLVGSYSTIQAAIDAGADGYTVWASAGTYNETVNLNKDITLEGPNAGTPGSAARTGEAIVNGIYVSADGATVDGLEVLNGTMIAGNPAGILVIADDVTLANLVLQGQGTPQMAAVLTGYNTNNTGLVLSDSLITGWAWGTYFNPSLSFTVTGNAFTGNGNDILGDGWTAGTIDDNSFHNSTGSHIGYGTYLPVEDMRDFVGTNNVFTGTGRSVGIFAYGDGNPGGQDITGTEFADGFFGSEFVAGSGNDSTFHGLGGNDYFEGAAGNDSIDGGGGTDTAAYDGTATIAETATGWSVTTATDGTDTLENVEIADDGAPGATRLVGNGGYASIQAAIDASSDGDVIIVASGTWTGNLNVDKDVTILGANNHGVAGTAARGDETVIDGQIVINAAGATIDGVRLVGAAAGSLGDTAVEVRANDFTLANSILDGDGDVAVFVGLVEDVDVHHNLIQGYSIGAYVSGGNTTGSIHDNRFQGDGGPATGLGNGVNSETSHVSIANNVFDGLYAGSLNIFPFGPDSVDLNSYITGNTYSNSGAARPVQILPTNLTHDFIGTDASEAFDGETAAGSYGVLGAFSYDGRGGNDHAWGGEQGDSLIGGSGDDQL